MPMISSLIGFSTIFAGPTFGVVILGVAIFGGEMLEPAPGIVGCMFVGRIVAGKVTPSDCFVAVD